MLQAAVGGRLPTRREERRAAIREGAHRRSSVSRHGQASRHVGAPLSQPAGALRQLLSTPLSPRLPWCPQTGCWGWLAGAERSWSARWPAVVRPRHRLFTHERFESKSVALVAGGEAHDTGRLNRTSGGQEGLDICSATHQSCSLCSHRRSTVLAALSTSITTISLYPAASSRVLKTRKSSSPSRRVCEP